MTNPPELTDSFHLNEAIRLLESTPATIQALVRNLPEIWLHFKEDPEAWSPQDVLVHYIHNERMNWIPRMRVILSDQPVRKFIPFQQMPDEAERAVGDAGELAAQFADLRAENLAFLKGLNLTDEQLDRTGEHPALGTVKLRNLLATWVVHDLNHLHQITKSLAKRYQAAVGPWKGYLGILE